MPITIRRRALFAHAAALLTAAALRPPAALAAAAVSPADPVAWRRDGVEQTAQALTVEGRFPAGLAGTFYRNGPAGHSVGGVRYRHWFDGDGMIQAWRIGPDGAAYASRYVRTHKRTAEQAAGRALFPAFATRPPGAPPLTPPARLNPANINILPLDRRVLALWETGPAWEIDPQSLDTRGEVVWRDDLRDLPFSAHPKTDPNGEVWNFGVHYPGGEMMLWRIGGDGTLKHFQILPLRHPGMLHDMAVTERSVLFVLTPYILSAERLAAGHSFLDAHGWRPDQPIRIVAVDKNDPTQMRTWEVPAGFGFHFSNAWEEADGTIRFAFTLAADPGVTARRLAGVMAGRWEDAAPLRLTAFTLRPGGGVTMTALSDGASEFPRINPRQVGRRHDAVIHLEIRDGAEWFNTVIRRDGEGAAVSAWRYPDGVIPEEHVFVPSPEGAGTGWVIGTLIDPAADRQGIVVFDACRLADGPLGMAWRAGAQPPGLHGGFVAA